MTTTRATTVHVDLALKFITQFRAEEAARMSERNTTTDELSARFDHVSDNFWKNVNEHCAPAVAKAIAQVPTLQELYRRHAMAAADARNGNS